MTLVIPIITPTDESKMGNMITKLHYFNSHSYDGYVNSTGKWMTCCFCIRYADKVD